MQIQAQQKTTQEQHSSIDVLQQEYNRQKLKNKQLQEELKQQQDELERALKEVDASRRAIADVQDQTIRYKQELLALD